MIQITVKTAGQLKAILLHLEQMNPTPKYTVGTK